MRKLWDVQTWGRGWGGRARACRDTQPRCRAATLRTQECLSRAKRLGYQIVATHLSDSAVDISQIDWTRPTAFVMGNEEKGAPPWPGRRC